MSRSSRFFSWRRAALTTRSATLLAHPPWPMGATAYMPVEQDVAAETSPGKKPKRTLLLLVDPLPVVPWGAPVRKARLVDVATGYIFWEGLIPSPPRDVKADDRRSTRPTAQSDEAPPRSGTSSPNPTCQAKLGPIGTIPPGWVRRFDKEQKMFVWEPSST